MYIIGRVFHLMFLNLCLNHLNDTEQRLIKADSLYPLLIVRAIGPWLPINFRSAIQTILLQLSGKFNNKTPESIFFFCLQQHQHSTVQDDNNNLTLSKKLKLKNSASSLFINSKQHSVINLFQEID
ncbi:hypothetical protein T01_6578 [Trichinella spiralis]|uniref:Uncharacterized protein n=1 Tax=Trichinella spiralis TaxID=6334 RepID=A0A0V1BPA8_TRISP|nr:hypothetical protein T01_6578 [Trichinella spiralis]